MLNQSIFNYDEERQEALFCHNIALWYKLFKEEQEEISRNNYYHNKFLDDDMNRCLGGF